MRIETDAPKTVRGAGLLVVLQGLVGVVFAVALLIRALSGAETISNLYGQAAYFVVLGGAVLGCGVALFLGKRGVRGPITVIQILLLGVAWYAIGPSDRPGYGIPVAAVSVLVLSLLFNVKARVWAEDRAGLDEDPD
ncbi:MAG: hypothetical protein WBA97_36500 [Actinophytocola sp.]|uniref:hypothetical protein n=1 Tax=Actinophytocola sp. TaxID=1872138 RepID=UPI003C7610F8